VDRAAGALIALGLAGAAAAWGQTQLPNPASQRCVAAGGMLQIEQRPDGGQFGVCVFAGDRQCEEWALLRGDCPAGGVAVGGLAPAARYCILVGGRYDGGRAACALPGGRVCSAEAYWTGGCGRP
jgi:putative hemolysin